MPKYGAPQPPGFWRWFWGEFWRTARPSLDSWGQTFRFILVLAAATACAWFVLGQLAGSGMSAVEEVTSLIGRI